MLPLPKGGGDLNFLSGYSFVVKRLDKVGVSHEHCIITDKVLPNSTIILSLATGSRTAVHYR